MSLSDAFITPAKGNQTCKKLCHVMMPTTYGTLTENLLKSFCQADPVITTLSINKASFPNFSKITLPPDVTELELQKIIHQMTIMYAANLASDAANSSTPKISFWDIETQHSNDIKLINNPIKDNADSFLQGLFEFQCAHEQLHGWASATYIVQHKATGNEVVDTDDDADEDDATKWRATDINLFKDFEKIHLTDMKSWAEDFWTSEDATLTAANGQSTLYACKALSKFIFGSVVSTLWKSIQNLISNSHLSNDGPYVWAVLVYHYFPSPITLKMTILHKMKTATLADHKNDLKSYSAALMDMNTMVDTSAHTKDLVTAFLTQIDTHPSDIVCNHFNQIGLKFYMYPDERQ